MRRRVQNRVGLLIAAAALLMAPTSASAGTLTVTVNAYANAGPSSGCNLFVDMGETTEFGIDPPCSGFPMGMVGSNVLAGTSLQFQTTAPPGIVINSASVTTAAPLSNIGSGFQWTGGSYYWGGGSHWYNGQTSEYDGSFNSSYWGFQLECASPQCLTAASIWLGGIRFTATENQGPLLAPDKPNNLWYQARPGEFIWNPPGDPWPITLTASDPSGVCSMQARVDGTGVPGPSWLPNTSQWQQCPGDPTWEQGAAIDTRDYVGRDGFLPLIFSATNAAGVETQYGPETLFVDNDPVSVSLTTPNDANPSVWVNHPVTVDATASAGPSHVGGTNCTVDHGAVSSYPATGLTVDGDGVHTVSCTAWNNAYDPQAQHNTGTNSMTIHIDEAPPSLSFEPQNPGDPTNVVVDTSDRESGVAGGAIAMAPAGTNDWTSLPTTMAGSRLEARFDDAGLRGPYTIRATSCDAVGNCASTDQRLAMPLRLASDSEVSLTKIVDPLRRRTVTEQVRVGWHWATIRRGGKSVRVKRGGHLKTIRVVKYVEKCTTKRVQTGPHRWRLEQTCRAPQAKVTPTLRVPYGHDVTINGLYMTAQGIPLAAQPVHILAAPDNESNAFTELGTVTTAADGSWSATLPPGPSRVIRAVTDGTATILPSSGQVTTIVPAKIELLRVWPRHVAWGGTVHLLGQLLGGYLPSRGALVRLRIGYGSTFNTYGVEEHVGGDGRFSTVASFGPGDASVVRTYWFQIASLPMGNFPYAPAASRRVPVTVGGT